LSKAVPLNQQLMSNMLLATQRYVACEDIWNEKTGCWSNFATYEVLFMETYISLLNHFVKTG